MILIRSVGFYNTLILIYHFSVVFVVWSMDGSVPHTHIAPTTTTTTTTMNSKSNVGGGMFADVLSYENIAHALRFTCEINRQLSVADNGMARLSPSDDVSVNTMNGLIDSPQEELTVFHQARPRELGGKRGVLRWGPDLSVYLEELYKALECSSPMCLVYALIYLDRACSVETRRVGSGVNDEILKCPYLTPRTVHRLVLTAMVMAAKATDPETIIKSNALGCDQYVSSSKRYAERLKAFGVNEKILATMEAKMLAALGEEGTYVQEYQLRECYRIWADALSFPSASNVGNGQESVVHAPMIDNHETHQYPGGVSSHHDGQQVQQGHTVVVRQSRQSLYVSTGKSPIDSQQSIPNQGPMHEPSVLNTMYNQRNEDRKNDQPQYSETDDTVPTNGPQDVSNSIGYYWT